MSQPTEWRSLGEDRLIMDLSSKLYAIMPRDFTCSMPLFCPVCQVIMGALWDRHAYRLFECCEPCANAWAYINAERWHASWRPDEAAIRDNVRQRNKRSLGFNLK